MQIASGDGSILDVLRKLSASRESGRLQVASGMTEGAVYLERGELVDARFGKLTGFQAINALASMRDATFGFEPSVTVRTQCSITQSERTLLHDFFGIGVVETVQENVQYSASNSADDVDTPAQVVPLSEVDEAQNLETVEPFARADSSTPLPSFTELPTTPPAASDDDEATLVKRKNKRPENRPGIKYPTISRSGLQAGLLVALLVLIAVSAFAVVYRLKQGAMTPAATVQTSAPSDPPTLSSSPSETSAETSSHVSTASQASDKREASTPTGSPQASITPEAASVASDLSGNWNVVNTVEQTSYQGYRNMQVGFELAINQNGNEFIGTGQKISENGRSLSGSSRTPISVRGSIDGDKVEATFSESGTNRKTSGRFVWKIDRAKGDLTGTFVSTAARTSGRSAATKRF